jgi:hypothetical protein
MKQLARAKFTSFNLRVPTNWKDPQGDPGAKHYANAFKAGERSTTPGNPPLFVAASANKYHTDTQKMLISEYGAFIDKTCEAICSAWSTWQTAASVAGLVVTGSMCTGGVLVGPPLTPLILSLGAMNSPMKARYTQVIATVIGNAWLTFTATVKWVAMNYWPTFNTFPSPLIPPPGIPNQVQLPFGQVFQVPASIMCMAMKPQMVGMFGEASAPFMPELFECICDAFEKSYNTWKDATMVTKVMAMGGVPTCVPPVMAPGPVVGTAIMLPGGLT